MDGCLDWWVCKYGVCVLESWGLYLWDEAVGHRDAGDAGDESGASEQEEVPVKSGWLFQGVLPALSAETANVLFDVSMSLRGSNIRIDWGITYMVIIEEQHDQESER